MEFAESHDSGIRELKMSDAGLTTPLGRTATQSQHGSSLRGTILLGLRS